MEQKEKTEFILEQLRLLVFVATEKDNQAKERKDKAAAAAKEKKDHRCRWRGSKSVSGAGRSTMGKGQ